MEVINCILVTYATGDIIAGIVKFLESYEQAPDLASPEVSKKLYTKVLRCGLEYEEKRIKSLVDKELDQAVCYKVCLHFSWNPSESLMQVAHYADTMTKIADDDSILSSSSCQPSWGLSSNRDRSRESSQSISVLKDTGSSSKTPTKSKNGGRQTSSGPVSD